MLSRIGWTRIAYGMAAIAVSCGAVGSHLLDDVLEGNAANQWQIATRMLFWHALGLWICASTARYRQGALMLISVLIFCGSVFSLSLGGARLDGNGRSSGRSRDGRLVAVASGGKGARMASTSQIGAFCD